jgi:8-oxo-dGTP pyrophosphatase MutT (NUDIX family)
MSDTDDTRKHRNDIYPDDINKGIVAPPDGQPPIPAATVVLLRDRPAQFEVLMLHRTSQIAFGGMWVFPGGRIDETDYPVGRDPNVAALNAALRETHEEAGLTVAPEGVVWFAHWTPPPGTPKRFATWFFAVRTDDHAVTIDGGEIQNHAWLAPAAALERHAAGEIDLAPPTWVTLHQLTRFASADAALRHLRANEPRYYQTRISKRADGVRIALWRGDAGYESWSADTPGARHRLVMAPGGFVFEDSGALQGPE